MPRSSSAASVRVAYTAPLAPVIARAMEGDSARGIQRDHQHEQIENADVAVEIEGALDLRQIVRAYERLLVDQQRGDDRYAGEVHRTEGRDQRQRDQTHDRDDVHRSRDRERRGHAEADRDRTQAVRAIEVEVLT